MIASSPNWTAKEMGSIAGQRDSPAVELDEEDRRDERGVLDEGEGKNGQAGHQHKRQEVVAGQYRRLQSGERIAVEEEVAEDVEQDRYADEYRERAMHLAHAFGPVVGDHQRHEAQGGEHAAHRQPEPRRPR